jgi:ATP-dependent Clp protease ATP-binding subunit ClpA
MRLDKLTTRFQQALSDAQSLAVGNDQQFIEPQHLLLALLNQDDGSTGSLLQRAGANVAGLKSALATDKEASSAATSSSPARCSCWPWPTPRPTSAASCAAMA